MRPTVGSMGGYPQTLFEYLEDGPEVLEGDV